MTDHQQLLQTLLADTERELTEIAALPEVERWPKLLLLALEREQIAAVAYSEDLVAERIATLPVGEDCREVVRRIVKWTHRDEALHAQYLRGLLLQSLPDVSAAQKALPAASIVARQVVGTVSGWVSAVSHHHNAEAWGLRRMVSVSAIRLGQIAGRIPDGLASELNYQGFRRFCLLNVVLEETAVLSYERILARKLHEWGATDVALIDTPMLYDRFFANRSVAEVADYFGFNSPLYRIVDAEDDSRKIDFERGLVSTRISGTWADASVRIVLSKLRGDPTELAHLSLASFSGIGSRTDEHLHTDRLVDHWTAALMALDVAPPDFAVVDAWAPVGDGPLGVMGCNKPNSVRRFYAGADPFSVDAAVFADMGFTEPKAAAFVRLADQWFGASSKPGQVVGEPGPLEGFRAPQGSLWFRFVSAAAAPIYFHLSGRGRWFVPAMDTDAFPPIDNPGPIVRTVRWAAQRVFGLHPPNQ